MTNKNQGLTAPQRVIDEGQALEQIQTEYYQTIRVQRPRDIAKATELFIEQARLAGEDFNYLIEFKDKSNRAVKFEGVSAQGIYLAALCYGNVIIQPGKVEKVPGGWMMKPVAIDAENNVVFERAYIIPDKLPVYGNWDEAKKEVIRFQAYQSRALRNVGAMIFPPSFLRAGIEAAKGAIRDNAADPKVKKSMLLRIIKRLADIGVSEIRVEAKFGKKIGVFTADDVVNLSGYFTEATEGNPDDVFPLTAKEMQERRENEKEVNEPPPAQEPTFTSKEDAQKPGPEPDDGRRPCSSCGDLKVLLERTEQGKDLCIPCDNKLAKAKKAAEADADKKPPKKTKTNKKKPELCAQCRQPSGELVASEMGKLCPVCYEKWYSGEGEKEKEITITKVSGTEAAGVGGLTKADPPSLEMVNKLALDICDHCNEEKPVALIPEGGKICAACAIAKNKHCSRCLRYVQAVYVFGGTMRELEGKQVCTLCVPIENEKGD